MKTLSAELAPHGLKIYVRGDLDGNANFLATLPEYRHVRAKAAGSCDATPAAAWRLMNEGPSVSADDGVLSLSSKFAEARRIVGGVLPVAQPPLRKGDLWPHQVSAYHFANSHDASMLALRMGEGKSAVAVLLSVNWGCRTVLVACPKSVMAVWRREFWKHSPVDANVVVLDKGTSDRKVKMADAAVRTGAATGQMTVIVVNYETARVPTFAAFAIKQKWDLVIADESHRVGDPATATAKFMDAVGRSASRRLCLTGTPMGDPMDLFGQFQFLDRGVFGTSYHRFRHRYADWNPMFPKMVDKWINQDELRERFRLLAFRVDGEVQSLPPLMMHDIPCELGTEARAAYSDIRDQFVAEYSGGMTTATNPLVKSLRLRQIVSGFCIDDETKSVRWIDLSKQIAVEEVIRDLPDDERVVVFCEFRAELEQVREIAAALKRPYGEVSGARKDLTEHAQFPDGVTIMGVQYQSGGVGIDLTRAAYVIIFSPTWSLINWEQAIKRLHRPGQTRTTHCYRVISEGTVDEAVYKALDNKREVVDEVLESVGIGVVPV